MYIQVLASGSKGNVTYLQFHDQKFLIDVGLSYKQLKEISEEHDIDLSSLTAVFITHEHSDHVKGLKTFCNKHKETPIFLSGGSCQGLKSDVHEKIEQKNIVQSGDIIAFSNVQVEVFELSHDALEPTGFIFYYEDTKVVLLTDTGYVSEEVKEKIKDADVYLLEFNHDPELLLHSHYPWHIKQRILSIRGHLSNEDASYLVEEVTSDKTKCVLFAHMSESNNMSLLVEEAVKKHVTKTHINFEFAYQNIATKKIDL